jgi:cell envelope opacity-associated protein A
MDKGQTWLDKQVKALIGDGDVSHLPNAGQKIAWTDDSHTPPDMRLAYKIMKDNNVTPEWIAMGEELALMHEKIMRVAKKMREDYITRLRDAQVKNSDVFTKEAETRWQSAQNKIAEMVANYNKQLLTYNISKPPHIEQRIPLILDELLAQ